MASKQPAHGSSTQTKEIHIDLVAEGIRHPGNPHHALAVVSVDANSTLHIEISAANEFTWQLEARIVYGSLNIIEILCEGDSVHEDDVAEWVERVAGVVGERLQGDR